MSDKIYPKCENARKLYIASNSQVRPCCWLSEWEEVSMDENWNLKNNTIEHILEHELSAYVQGLKENPEKFACKMCYRKCNQPFTETANPTQQYVIFGDEDET